MLYCTPTIPKLNVMLEDLRGLVSDIGFLWPFLDRMRSGKAIHFLPSYSTIWTETQNAGLLPSFGLEQN